MLDVWIMDMDEETNNDPKSILIKLEKLIKSYFTVWTVTYLDSCGLALAEHSTVENLLPFGRETNT